MEHLSLDALFTRMRDAPAEAAEAAWGEVYRRYQQRVWARVYYVIRTIPWLREPDEVATDVTTQVFVGLPAAVARYRDVGRAEQWLLRVALRTALRHRESLTGNWSDSRRPKGSGGGRSFLDLDDAVNRISQAVDEAERDERFELHRRLDAWRADPDRASWVRLIDLFLEGYTHEEIAEQLGITPGTSRTWMWKIRRELGRSAAEPDMTDEVQGRDTGVRPIRPGAGEHLTADVLLAFADGVLGPEEDAAAALHVGACAVCADTVDALRRGLAVLAGMSRPPAELEARVRRGRATGPQPLLPPESVPGFEADFDEVVGRQADPEAPPPQDESEQ